MKTARATRIAITSGAAVLCLGVAAPSVAYACNGDGPSYGAHPDTATAGQFSTPTLQQEQQSWIDSFVSHRTAWLDHLSAVVSADPELTADQQAQALDSIAKAKTALTDLQSAVDAATSTDQVRDLVKAALEAMPMPHWPHPMTQRHAFGHHVPNAMHRDARAHHAAPTDVSAHSADKSTRPVRYGAYLQTRNRDFGTQHWSQRGYRWSSHRGDAGWDGWSGGHRDGGGGHHHGGWDH